MAGILTLDSGNLLSHSQLLAAKGPIPAEVAAQKLDKSGLVGAEVPAGI